MRLIVMPTRRKIKKQVSTTQMSAQAIQLRIQTFFDSLVARQNSGEVDL